MSIPVVNTLELRNPDEPPALRGGDVHPGVAFVCITVASGAEVMRGTFLSAPYYTDCYVADVELPNGAVMAYELYELGVTVSPRDGRSFASTACLRADTRLAA